MRMSCRWAEALEKLLLGFLAFGSVHRVHLGPSLWPPMASRDFSRQTVGPYLLVHSS